MSLYSIGYRLSFDDIEPKNIDKYVSDYLELFDRFEIKITQKLISSGNISSLLCVLKNKAKESFSLHLLKDILVNRISYIETVSLMPIFNQYKTESQIYLVTHLPEALLTNYLGEIFSLSEILPQNYMLLLENVEKHIGNFEYLEQINRLCHVLDKGNAKNVGICLDIGHLLFGFHQEGISQERALTKLQQMPYLLSRIKEIHLHDYEANDHLPLQKGVMNLGIVSNFIKKNNLTVPIILEVTVQKPDEDGIRQIALMQKLLEI